MISKENFQILCALSIIGLSCWRISDYFGGMSLYFVLFWMLITPLAVLYTITLIATIFKIWKTGFKENKLIFRMHTAFIVFIMTVTLIDSELFKSKIILEGTLRDDLSNLTLILREDGTCENNVTGMLGFSEQHKGAYKMAGDTIIFTTIPYDNNFIPDTVLLNREQNAIIISRDENGEFSSEKGWLNHFELKR